MRWLSLLGLAVVPLATGCLPHADGDDDYLLVVESGQLAPTDDTGAAWCPSGEISLKVSVTVQGLTNHTSLQAGLMPHWHEALVSAPADAYAAGMRVLLVGACDGQGLFPIGSLWVHPDADDVRNGTEFLMAVTHEATVRIHFIPSDDGSIYEGGDDGSYGGGDDEGDPGTSDGGYSDGSDPGGTPPPDACDDGSCVWLDPGTPPPDTVDPGDDCGEDCVAPVDPGSSGDDGGAGDPGSGDDGSGGGDCGCSGGGDDGGDDGGYTGGDDGGDDGSGDSGGDDGGGDDGGADGFTKLPFIWNLVPAPHRVTQGVIVPATPR